MRTRLITLCLLVLCIGLSAGHFLPDAAATATQGAAASSAVFYQTFAGIDFQGFYGGQGWTTTEGAVHIITFAKPDQPMHLRLDLPSGATITNVRFYCVDNVAGAGLDFRLLRYDPASTAPPQLVVSGSTTLLADDPSIQSISLNADVLVDNSQYTYFLSAGFGAASPSLQLTGARVVYTMPTTYLPLVNR